MTQADITERNRANARKSTGPKTAGGKAIAARKHIYCEKPTASVYSEAIRIAEIAEKAGVKNGTVQDKLWLPGIRKYQLLKESLQLKESSFSSHHSKQI